jgi:PLP dependent protein
MLTGPQFLAARIAFFREKMAAAERDAGRAPGSVTLVGVTKTHPPETVREAHGAGLSEFGENYLQEAALKIAALPREGLLWHYIGQLQTNKTRTVAELFDWVHTIDRLKVAERLSAQRSFHGPPLMACVQVKLAAEDSKGGVAPEALAPLAHAVAHLPRLKLRGLMCVPPASADAAVQRGYFARLRRLRDDLNADGLDLDVLSMGMSGDFEAAIHEGATHIRIGTALFGERDPTP